MRQVLHIFRKDCRQFWPEILASLLITALFVWVYPYQSLSADDPRFLTGKHLLDLRHLKILASTLATLMVFCWFFVTARVVHAENLLGNRQFWVTRPYRWQSLLAEKVLFVTVFLYLPFAISQLALLARGGFTPWHYFPNLLYLLSLIYGAVGLVFLAFSSVMSSLLRMILFLLAAAALIGIIAFFASSGSHDSVSVRVPVEDPISTPLSLVIGLTTLVAVYSGRRIWLGRCLLLTFVGLVTLFGASPWDPILLPHVYAVPPARDGDPLHASTGGDLSQLNAQYFGSEKAYIQVPAVLTGIGAHEAVDVDNLRMIIEAADGSHTEIPWHGIYNWRIEADKPTMQLSGELDRATFDRIRSKPLQVRVSLAVTEIAPDAAARTYRYSGDPLPIPGIGTCSDRFAGDFREELHCKFPFHSPPITRITLTSFCSKTPEDGQSRHRLTAWVGYWSHDPSDFSLSPIEDDDISLREEQTAPQSDGNEVCHDSTLELIQYHVVRRRLLSFVTPAFQFNSPETDKKLNSK
jgi:hypothetical protein